MLRLIIMLLAICLPLCYGCSNDKKAASHTDLILYSEMDADFTESIVREYNQQSKDGTVIQAIYELKDIEPDIVLCGTRTLNGFCSDNKLQPIVCSAGDRLPIEFKDSQERWYGAFYDPAVFLINQGYARKIGQENLKGWSDLEDRSDIRIALENLSNSNSTQNFLGAFASRLGESISLNYLWNINRFIGQYAKFPFTPIRMTAVGDADLALTRQSYVFKYLENNFPAYVVFPEEGTPVNLYGAAVFSSSKKAAEATDFIDWLITDAAVKRISLEKNTGFMFLLPQGIDGPAADPNKLWLNTTYLSYPEQEKLNRKWLDLVRFSNDK